MGTPVSARTSLTNEVILNTPWLMLGYVNALHAEIQTLRERIEQLEAKLKQDSTNSNKPPSSDNPFTKGKESAPKSAKAKKTRKGTRQQCLRPTKITEIFPGKCICGCGNLTDIEPYYTHQVVELPEIELEVTHLILYREALPALPESSKGARCAGTKSGLWPEIVGDDCRDGRKPS